jgi:beta-lactamase regulating signal transducer with metallopeptidase domain/HEAT repeat protein
MFPSLFSGINELPARDFAMLVLLVKATIILLAAFGITVAMQRASAGARHLVWLVALGALLIVPALTAWGPLRLEILPPAVAARQLIDPTGDKPVGVELDAKPVADANATAPNTAVPNTAAANTAAANTAAANAAAPASGSAVASAPVTASVASRVSAMSALSIVLAIWAGVALLIAASLAWSALVVRRIVRQATPLDGEEWTSPLYEVADRLGLDDAPRLLRSEASKMPFACGVLTPTIVLPAESDGWTLDRRRAVLLHELAHVRRRDLVGHTLGRLACACYWFHPLVWTAARELRSESERACDDLALSCGTGAADYAEHLLDIVTSVRRDATPSVALAMARRKEFEGRMLAILDPQLRHSSPSRGQSAALISSLAVIALIVGAAAPARRVDGQATDTAATPQPFEQHSAPGGYAFRRIEQKAEHQATRMSSTISRSDSQAAERAARSVARQLEKDGIVQHVVTNIVPRVVQDVVPRVQPIMPEPFDRGTDEVSQLRRLASAPRSKASDDRPVLLAKILRTDANAELRRIAAWGLSEYANTDVASDALANAVAHDSDVNVREMAAWALGDGDERSNHGASDALAAALKSDASVKVRATAAWALGNIGSRSTIPALVAALNDASPEVRRRALWAIGNAEPHEAPKEVMALLKDKDPEVRELAAWALYEIEDPQSAPALNAALKVETDKDLQISYIRAIAAMGEKSVDAIRELLESSDPKIKSMAVRALAGGDAAGPWPWPWPEPRPYP